MVGRRGRRPPCPVAVRAVRPSSVSRGGLPSPGRRARIPCGATTCVRARPGTGR
ncbi:hypothetical protein STRIP9103_02280 [Streptomyces ipomoeae 91-03]|uniref:Uncharacterized protein n=1 Tax=Streptomyces ipomoeae 91-03 TaxID=698759 RepID=L1KV70_9ACTN|nr:hypothetical protein STRIP9103_02280 [Streptomyces ipomoeae 91-03]